MSDQPTVDEFVPVLDIDEAEEISLVSVDDSRIDEGIIIGTIEVNDGNVFRTEMGPELQEAIQLFTTRLYADRGVRKPSEKINERSKEVREFMSKLMSADNMPGPDEIPDWVGEEVVSQAQNTKLALSTAYEVLCAHTDRERKLCDIYGALTVMLGECKLVRGDIELDIFDVQPVGVLRIPKIIDVLEVTPPSRAYWNRDRENQDRKKYGLPDVPPLNQTSPVEWRIAWAFQLLQKYPELTTRLNQLNDLIDEVAPAPSADRFQTHRKRVVRDNPPKSRTRSRKSDG